MIKKVLITGITGFVGSHLAELLLSKKYEVHGVVRWRSKTENIDSFKDKLILHDGDITDLSSLIKILKQVKPNYIFHLAAQSFVLTSWKSPGQTLYNNIIGTSNLLEAVTSLKDRDFNPVIQIAASSEEYGLVLPSEIPIKETNPLRPLSPYGVSKVATDMLALQHFRSYGIKTVITRAFNHSVSKWTPVLIKDNLTDLVDTKYISEIRQKQKKGGYLSGVKINDIQLWNMKRHSLSIWTDVGWKKIKTISCHPIRNNKLLKIATRQSVFDVTDNHSILDAKGTIVDASKTNIGDKLFNSELPKTSITKMPLDLAWLYGFFTAEGCITTGRIRIYSNDKSLIDKCEKIIKKYVCKGCYRKVDKNGTIRLVIRRPDKLAKQWHPQFYAKDRNKRIPRIILNATKDVKLSFLKGFNDGDGLKKGYNSSEELKSFKTKSPILALGLCFLIENTTKQRYTISVEQRNDRFYYGINLNSRKNTKEGKHLRKTSNEIVKKIELSYKDEVWDFETENQHFHCGIGRGIVHNTGPRRGEVFVCSTFAKQIAEIEKGKRSALIYHGNLETKRDFTDARDMVRAYLLAAKKCKPGEVYNICSGKKGTFSMKEILLMLLSLTDASVKLRKDSKRMRPSDVPILLGDCTKFRKATGWKPVINFKKTLEDLLNYWRERV